MNDYKQLEAICQHNNDISKKVVDEFLIYYAADNDKLEPEMNRRLSPYMHIAAKFPQEWINMTMAQYIAHRTFKKGGLINKYVKHSAMKSLDDAEMSYLEQGINHPWRFSFSEIVDNPAKDFYNMYDVFTGDTYLLYSPGIDRVLQDQNAMLWFNLIAYNGSCWQSYGPIAAYQSFEPDDIFFFATELNPSIETDEDLSEDVEKNPIPYMLLMAGSQYPVSIHQNDQVVFAMSENDQETFDTERLNAAFKVEYANEVYRLTLNEWGDPPHFATAYYNEKKQVLQLSAMTDRGYQALVATLNDYGYNPSDEPDIRINPSMLTTAQDILKKDIDLHEYEALFPTTNTDPDDDTVDKLNVLMGMVMEDINAGKEPDIEAMADKAGVDIEMAREVVGKVRQKFDDMKRGTE